MTRWGLVATIKAPLRETLEFAAYHLEQGAHRLYIYLDDPIPEVYAALKAHPKVRVTACDDAYWRKMGQDRPAKHQQRQTINATHAYGRKTEVDWLIHMDVDEFLWPEARIEEHLAALPDTVLCARSRPMESLAGTEGYFKAFIPAGSDRDWVVAELYPNFGQFVKGGFMSHLAGKLFVRTGLGPMTFRIHNVFRSADDMNPGQVELTEVALCHCHAKSWEHWIDAYRFRLNKGAYRAELAPSRPREKGGLTMHELLSAIEAEGGEAALRAFHTEICADTPRLREALEQEGLLRHCDLQLPHVLDRQFPDCR